MKVWKVRTCKLGRMGVAATFAAIVPAFTWAQVVVSEDFTGTTLNNTWTAINGACLTAGASSNGSIPSCVGLRYYTTNGDAYQVGGQSGYLGGNTAPSSNASEIPDPIISGIGYGALRLTNGLPNYHESGAIVSTTPFSASAGVQITFKTVTYEGNSGGSGGDGADGISFFLLDASQYAPGSGLLGSWGGSLGYSCSNSNSPYTGQVGAYVGLGIDEYGNFLNGGTNKSGGYNDNTATGVAAVGWGSGNYQWNRIGLRGAGNVAWSWLSTNYPAYYPSTLTVAQQATAVQTTCETGVLWNYSAGASSPTNTGIAVADYAPIPNGSAVLPKGLTIANEAATTRAQATPIYYVLQITNNGLLSLAYSYGGGSLTQVLTNQSITASNGALPAQLLFGFAGSTGGSDNVHEILCFQAEPPDQSDASTTVNLPLDKLVTSAQVYLPSYHTNNWWGQLVAQALYQSGTYTLSVGQVNWDASCVLTGGACQSMSGSPTIPVESPGNRTILTWNGTNGVPFEWGILSAVQQSELDPSAVGAGTSTRLNYLRGDRSDEVPSSGGTAAQIYRDRTGVLGDIIHASPFWVGAPANISYESNWTDNLYPSAVAAENAGGAENYQTFYNNYSGRENVVYAGANDGLLHGFRSGSYANGTMVTTSYPNDGWEVLAYMPGAVVESIHSTSAAYDYASPNYSHVFSVDAPPRGDDLFYNSAWHTWLVGGLGAGGGAIYALDVTDPTQFSEGNAASLVQGEWTSATLSCANVANCGSHLGDTFGTPVIWRFHATNAQNNNMWGMVFGNGFPNTISANISSTFTGSIGNRFTATIGDFFTGTIAAKTLTVTDGTPPALNATISGLNVTSGTTITSVPAGGCTAFPCSYGLSHKSTVSTAEQMTSATTNMYVSAGSGLATGQTLKDGPLAGTTIVSQISGTAGGPGVYQVSTAQLLASTQILGTGNVLVVSANGVGLAVGQTITDTTGNIAPGTTILSQIDGTPGELGHYLVSVSQVVTGEQMSNGLTALTVVGGNGLAVGQTISGPGIAAGTKITSMGSGTGGPGIYAVNQSQTVALTQMTASSAGGTAGIYVMLVDPASGARSFYYLDTGYGPANDPLGQARYNGIAFTAPVDLDGDNTVDYVYAGDLFGNLWRFDLTSNNPSNWAVSKFGNANGTPLFSSPATLSSGSLVDQPITTKPVVSISGQANGAKAVIINFGTGQENALTPISPTSYAPGPQALYGIWDWDMSNWNSLSHMSLASATEAQVASFLGGPITPGNLTVQTLTQYTLEPSAPNVETDTSNPVCWYGSGVCSGGNPMFGWQITLPGTDEQVIYNPTIWQGILQVNTTVPSVSTVWSCTVYPTTGWTMLIDPATGGEFSSSAFLTTSGSPMTYGSTGTPVSGVQTNGTGSITNITAGGQNFFLTDTSNGTPLTGGEQAVAAVAGHRVTWSQLR